MRDPDLMQRADRAAIGLEQAWERWRAMHGLGSEPLPPVSSYVGYSLEEPWGQPRVVFGLRADEAELLASLLDGHDCVGSAYADLDARLDWRLGSGSPAPLPARGYGGALGVPAQAPPPGIDLLPPGPPDGFAVGRLSDEDAMSAEPDEDSERRQAAPRAAGSGSARARATRAARPDRAGRAGPETADDSADAVGGDEASWPAVDGDAAPPELDADDGDALPDAAESELEPLPEVPDPRSRSAEAADEPAPRAPRAKAAAGRGPGYRGPRYQGFPPRYDSSPRAESSASPASLADDGDDAEAAAEGAASRRSHASKLSRSARRRTQSS